MQTLEHSRRKLVVLAGRSKEPKEALLSAAASMSAPGRSVRLLNADLVFGIDHVISAFRKAARAMDEGQNVSDSLATETMLYMSGCRQIQEAVELFGLQKGSGTVVCLADEGCAAGSIASELKLNEDDGVLSAEGKELHRFGIRESEIETVPKGRADDLVLERVAGVDIKKK